METFKYNEVVTYGSRITSSGEIDENVVKKWKTGVLPHLNGYTVKRSFSKFIIILKIEMSKTFKSPLFVGEIYDNEKLVKTFCCTNATATCKQLMNFLEIPCKGKIVGNYYYGIYRSEYRVKTETLDTEEFLGEVENVETKNISTCRNRQSDWLGVIDFGKQIIDDEAFTKMIGKVRCFIRPGYHSQRSLKISNTRSVVINLKVEQKNNQPYYRAYTVEDPIIDSVSENCSKCIKHAMELLGVESRKHWIGFEYFGFMKAEVMEKLTQIDQPSGYEFSDEDKDSDSEDLFNDAMHKTLHNVRKRNAGATKSLCKKSIKSRNEFIHELVKYASFNDVQSYVEHLMQNFPELVDNAMEDETDYITHVVSRLKLKTLPKSLSCKETAEILMGKCNVSQRAYKMLKKILQANEIKLPRYDSVRQFCKDIDVGSIKAIHGPSENKCMCMGYRTEIKDETLQKIFSTEKLYSKMTFFTLSQQQAISDFIKAKNPTLYQSFNVDNRTIVLRDTGDNFRASSRYPTEQTSYSVLNLIEFAVCPYGQFISTAWRGKESREMLYSHVKFHYDQLTNLVKDGITLQVNGVHEHFNVIVLFVADLSFVKEMLGRCSSTHTYGCFHCELPISDWHTPMRKSGKKQSIKTMIQRGNKAKSELGENPDKEGTLYKKFTRENYGQWAPVLLEGIIVDFIPPCGLHLILAHHRYLWKVLHRIVTARKQEELIPAALRKIGCFYLAFQLDTYFKSKKKYYDGSETLRMIGNDCKLIEDNIDTFLNVFVESRNQNWNDESCQKLRHILKLYKLFKDLARDIRAIHVDKERVDSFQQRAEEFFKLFISNAPTDCVKGMPYFHYLRNHLGDVMKLYSNLFGWGYGVFSTNAGEHLNKIIKQCEINHTNLDANRFYTIIHLIRTKQFEFTDSIMPQAKKITCSACNQIGHNKKNKSCPLHPSHPPLEFDDTDLEEEEEEN